MRLASFVLAASLAVGVTYVSITLKPRFDSRAETIANQFALLDGEPLHIGGGPPVQMEPFRNRVLFPALLRGASRLGGLSTEDWYLFLRLGTAFGAFLAFYGGARSLGASERVGAAASLLLAFALVPTFNHSSEHPTDFLDVAVFALAVPLVLRRRLAAVAVLGLVAAANRESAAFLGVLWAGVHAVPFGPGWAGTGRWRDLTGRSVAWRDVALGAALAASSYAAVLALRVVFGGAGMADAASQTFAPLGQLQVALRYALDHPSPFSWIGLGLAMGALPVMWLASNRRSLDGVARRLLALSGALAVPTLLFGHLDELRVFIPSLVLLLYAAARGEAAASGAPPVLSGGPAPEAAVRAGGGRAPVPAG
jgi:hypothetical protein